jgi:glutamyl-tRNA reductase
VAEALYDYDVVFSATHAGDFIVTRIMAADASAVRTAIRPQVYIDLAVPRDIDPTVRSLPGIVLIDVDDLRHGLDESQATRVRAVPAVNTIIDEEVVRWQASQRELTMRPYVVELRQRAERIRQHEVERTMRFLGPVDAATREHVYHLSRALVNKLLHEPTIRIKELAHEDEAEAYVSTICDIFGLDVTPEAPSATEEQNGTAAEISSNAIRGQSLRP